jgi:hypothetical protein
LLCGFAVSTPVFAGRIAGVVYEETDARVPYEGARVLLFRLEPWAEGKQMPTDFMIFRRAEGVEERLGEPIFFGPLPVVKESYAFETETASGAAGVFEFAGLPAGKYHLMASEPTHVRSFGETVSLGADQDVAGVELVIKPGAFVSGHVFLPGGQVPPPGQVELFYANQPASQPRLPADVCGAGGPSVPNVSASEGGACGNMDVTLDQDGRFRLGPYPAGAGALSCRIEGYACAKPVSFDLTPGEDTTNADIVVSEESGGVQGVVLTPDGAPFAGTGWVRLRPGAAEPVGDARRAQEATVIAIAYAVQIAPGGQFQFDLVPPGAYRISVSPDGATETQVGIDVKDGEVTIQDVTLGAVPKP